MTDAAWLRETWSDLAKADQVLIGIRVRETENLAQYCSVDQVGNFVYYSTSSTEPQAFRQLATLKSAVTNSSGTWKRSITLLEPEFFDEFAVLIDSLVASTRLKGTEQSALNAQSAAYEQWLAFYRRKGGFTLEVARGLFGELHTARWLLESRKLTWLEVLDSWRGPFGAAQDFILGSELAIEVKCVQLTSKRVRVSSLEQLSFPGTLQMRVLRLTNTLARDRGQTLKDLMAELIPRMNPHERSIFQELVAQTGYVSDSEFANEYFFIVEGIETYRVEESFPKITGDWIPSGIDSVEYQINLDLVKSYLVSGEK